MLARDREPGAPGRFSGGRQRLAGATALFLALLTIVAVKAGAAPGSLDHGFGDDGRRTINFAEDDHAGDVVVQRTGKIVVAGDSNGELAVARLNANGSLDDDFSGNGRHTIGFSGGSAIGHAVAIQGGKIVVAGFAGSPSVVAVARLNANGGPDTTFSSDGRKTFEFAGSTGGDFASAVAIQRDGRIVVVGGSSRDTDDGEPTAYDFAVARLKPNGSADQTFSDDGQRTIRFANGSGNDLAWGLALQGTKIVVAGYSRQAATGDDFAVVRLNANGSLDQTFSEDGRKTLDFGTASDIGEDVAIQPNGRIVVAGHWRQDDATGTQFALARFHPNGSLDQTFSGDGRKTMGFANGSGDDEGRAVAIQPNGRIVVAGITGSHFGVARFKASGDRDRAFSNQGRRAISFSNDGYEEELGFGLALRGDKIIVAGVAYQGNGFPSDFALAQLLAD